MHARFDVSASQPLQLLPSLCADVDVRLTAVTIEGKQDTRKVS